jgi:hypothetical protein
VSAKVGLIKTLNYLYVPAPQSSEEAREKQLFVFNPAFHQIEKNGWFSPLDAA